MNLGQCPFSYALTDFASHESWANILNKLTRVWLLRLDT